jgi:hypothetical protein
MKNKINTSRRTAEISQKFFGITKGSAFVLPSAYLKNKEHRESTSYFTTARITDGKSTFGLKFNYFRSPLDYAYALHLKDCDIPFSYEKQGFEIEMDDGLKLHYIPDFHILGTNKYIEIVNKFTKKLRIKTKLFIHQYPENKLEIITKDELIKRGIIDAQKS